MHYVDHLLSIGTSLEIDQSQHRPIPILGRFSAGPIPQPLQPGIYVNGNVKVYQLRGK
jgi:hypothetical protein